ncbi:Uncharacterised protein [Segatella copri]|nr:Uncharacterised protein [Segatella copri]
MPWSIFFKKYLTSARFQKRKPSIDCTSLALMLWL